MHSKMFGDMANYDSKLATTPEMSDTFGVFKR